MPTTQRQSVVIDTTKRMMKLKLWVLAPIVIFLGAVALLNSVNYSVGFRTGILNKLSSKGLFCWTTEGQLALANFSRSGDFRAREENLDNTFYFSVPSAKVRERIEALPPGSPVTLEYRQKLFALAWPLPFLCVRRTQYEIVDVRPAPAYPSDTSIPVRPP